MAEFDTVIRNGTVVEATGIPAYRADVAIKDGKIAQMSGSIKGSGAKELDARAVGGALQARGWLPNVWEGPPSVHVRILPSHVALAEEFVEDVRGAVADVRSGEVTAGERIGMYAD